MFELTAFLQKVCTTLPPLHDQKSWAHQGYPWRLRYKLATTPLTASQAEAKFEVASQGAIKDAADFKLHLTNEGLNAGTVDVYLRTDKALSAFACLLAWEKHLEPIAFEAHAVFNVWSTYRSA